MDKSVWNEFGDKPDIVARIAAEIIEDSVLYNENEQLNSTVSDEEAFAEGKIITETHKRKERNKNIRKTIIAIRKKNNTVFCDLCGMKPYFDDSIDECAIFECHHIIPLSQSGGLVETKIDDIAFLCSNCHKAIHSKIAKEKKWITPEEMKNFVSK